MSRMKLVSTLAVLALACTLAPLAHAATTTTKPAMTAKATGSAKAHMMKVDLNTASREDLMKLPGIGDAIADKIIADRPFKAKSELLSKGLVNKAQYAKLSTHVIARQAEEPAAKK